MCQHDRPATGRRAYSLVGQHLALRLADPAPDAQPTHRHLCRYRTRLHLARRHGQGRSRGPCSCPVQPIWLGRISSLFPVLPGDIWDSVVTRLLPGFFIGLALGMLVGVSMAVSMTFALADPLVEAIRPLPPLAFIPLFILWFGIGSGTQVALIAFGTFIVMVITSYEAVRNVPPITFRPLRRWAPRRGRYFVESSSRPSCPTSSVASG